MKVFYRLGTSIEHTSNKNATNTLNPQDHEKYAEALAGIVRHYTRGWADGFKWDIEYWELFNEPNITPCWRGTRDEFIDLFVTCLKRLKGEFPELKIGGPALAWLDEPFMRELFAACKKAGVAPDFFSWHWYGLDPEEPVRQTARAKALVAECGFPDIELILNEWHYLAENNWDAVRGPREAWLQTHTGPAAMNGVDSAAFTMTVEAKRAFCGNQPAVQARSDYIAEKPLRPASHRLTARANALRSKPAILPHVGLFATLHSPLRTKFVNASCRKRRNR